MSVKDVLTRSLPLTSYLVN